jgi:general nucleoside transport system ATP-binding protein
VQPRPVLSVRDLRYVSERGVAVLNGVSFELAAGEILGVAGVAQNGQEELAETITGQRHPLAGSVQLAGEEITRRPVRAIRALGLGHIPDDRYAEGCAPSASLARNLLMGLHHRPAFSRRGLLNAATVRAHADRLIAAYGIRAAHRDAPLASLSGGNAQKAIVARELEFATQCLVAEQPSRGVDIGAADFIYEQLHALSRRGVGILLFSTDLTEVLRLSHRILVMYQGRVAGETRPEDTTLAALGLLMAGAQPERVETHA